MIIDLNDISAIRNSLTLIRRVYHGNELIWRMYSDVIFGTTTGNEHNFEIDGLLKYSGSISPYSENYELSLASCVAYIYDIGNELTLIHSIVDCISVTDMYFPEVTTLEVTAFNNMASLVSVYIPKIHTVKDRAFALCKKLEHVDLGNMQKLGANAFYSCDELKSILLSSSNEKFSVYTLDFLPTLCGQVLVRNETSALDWVAKEYAIDMQIPEFIAEITTHALHTCKKLKTVEFTDNLTAIGQEAFSNTALSAINLRNVKKFEELPFYSCTNLSVVTKNLNNTSLSLLMPDMSPNDISGSILITKRRLPIGIPDGGTRQTENCVTWASIPLTEYISLPHYVDTINGSAIRICSKMKWLSAENVFCIRGSAIANCYDLSAVYIPNVMNIGGSFVEDTSLKEIHMENILSAPILGSDKAFNGIPKNQISAFVPSGLIDQFKNAVNWSGLIEDNTITLVGV